MVIPHMKSRGNNMTMDSKWMMKSINLKRRHQGCNLGYLNEPLSNKSDIYGSEGWTSNYINAKNTKLETKEREEQFVPMKWMLK